jgi:ankyrin repeat protein
MSVSSSAPPEWDQLLAASQKNLPDTIRSLISDGVDPNHANRVGQSALHIAAIWAHGASLVFRVIQNEQSSYFVCSLSLTIVVS